MTGELEWQGFASLVESGMREALDAAGVDCAMPGRPESEYDAALVPEHAADDQSSP